MGRRVFLAIIGCFPLLIGLIHKSRAASRPLVDYAYSTGEHYHDPENEAYRICD